MNFAVLNALSRYSPRGQKYIDVKIKLLDNAKDLYKGRKKIIEGFKNEIFLLIKKDFVSDGQRPDSPATFDSNIHKSYGLSDKELQIFKNFLEIKALKRLRKL